MTTPFENRKQDILDKIRGLSDLARVTADHGRRYADEIATLRAERSISDEQIRALEENLARTSAEAETLRTTLETMRAEAETARAEALAVKAEADAVRKDLDAQARDHETVLAEAAALLDRAMVTLREGPVAGPETEPAAKPDAEPAATPTAGSESESESKTELDNLNRELERAYADIDRLESEIKSLEAMVKDLEERLQMAEARGATLADQLEAALLAPAEVPAPPPAAEPSPDAATPAAGPPPVDERSLRTLEEVARILTELDAALDAPPSDTGTDTIQAMADAIDRISLLVRGARSVEPGA